MKTQLNDLLEKPHQGQTDYTAKDFKPNVDVRWCAGCGAISVLSPSQRLMPELGIPKEKIAYISGIGCSGRFPYYMDTYGFHSIHGRALPIASGLKIARPDLSVWVVMGDGDNMSIGGNHFIHTCRRNVDLNVMMFNNEVYSLTKGQYSPTSHRGQITKSSPLGALDDPFNPAALALGAGATFVARGHDKDRTKLHDLLKRAYEHKGVSFVEIYTNCRIFNDGAFDLYTSVETRDNYTIELEHGKPLVFGKTRNKGIILDGYTPKVVNLDQGEYSINDLLIHNEKDSTLAFILANMTYSEELPRPMGVIQAVQRASYEERVVNQIEHEIVTKGEGDLQSLLTGESSWLV
ncbi:2-oxoacid:ferredoxin oxidoreductase subunit beta [Imperialibacter roseus]|uniref:2-oxoacid:ferredoxin oxidoreductase subunit beta n=1 Tax=Imperialibacter roseus TaxID=1324217 RepID=A0ABZ0IX56_9BACT|nr:2-oxoacid:ferredoxin oxidoreductase subunit beta [Imperialibacter roseus]WOK08979.1 2-oxoacid:ferredoxin oxidoreductase subunit beta [Imperialibacter roseus]